MPALPWIFISICKGYPNYQPAIPDLYVTGSGNVTQEGVKSNSAYESIERVFIQGEINATDDGIFKGFKNIKEVFIQTNSFISLGSSSFEDCIGLETIELPDSLKVISPRSFCKCSKLRSVKFPSNLVEIMGSAFYSCSSLETVSFPDSVQYLRSLAFAFSGLKGNVTLPSNIKLAESSIFQHCAGIKHIDLRSIEELGYHALYCMTGIFYLKIPKSVQKLGSGFIRYTLSLKKVEVEAGSKFFASDEQGIVYTSNYTEIIEAPCGITEAIIPATVTKIHDFGFNDCKYLKKVVIPDSVSSLGTSSFFACHGLQSISIGTGVKELKSQVFGSTGLREFDTGNGVEIIRTGALNYLTNIGVIRIGSNVRTIQVNSFLDTAPINEIYVNKDNTFFESINGTLFEITQ